MTDGILFQAQHRKFKPSVNHKFAMHSPRNDHWIASLGYTEI
jgi:hypothetical protein